MLFNSYAFILGYLPVTLAGFFLLAQTSQRLAALWLAAASLFFYGWWNPMFLVLVMASITVNYAFGYAIGHARLRLAQRATMVLTLAVIANLALLAYYKYANFFIANLSKLTGTELTIVNIVLPLGISFFTFTQIAFLVDVYRGIAREYNFIHYVLFITYFPHLIAGPVLHHKQMMPQFGHPETYRINLENINIGLTIFIIGLAKKVLLADQFALYANPVFDVVAHGGEPKLIEAWIGALAYTLQLYFDFSGYSDMAIGLSRMFNIKLPLNFDSPYKAPNIIEFWRRWHMTLSSFLRDYLYIPLGGGRKGVPRRYINLMITMLLGGLWHGAGWVFILWGGLHGVYLVINHGWQRLFGGGGASGWRTVGGVGLTFFFVVLAWVPFRAPTLDAALRMWAGMFGANGISLPEISEALIPVWLNKLVTFDGLSPLAKLEVAEVSFALSIGLAIVWVLPNVRQMFSDYKLDPDHTKGASSGTNSRKIPNWYVRHFRWKPNLLWLLVTSIFSGLSLALLGRHSEFLYFQF